MSDYYPVVFKSVFTSSWDQKKKKLDLRGYDCPHSIPIRRRPSHQAEKTPGPTLTQRNPLPK